MKRKVMAGMAGVAAVAAIGLVTREEPCASTGVCVQSDGGVMACQEMRAGATAVRNCERVTCVAPPDTEPCEPQP